MIDLWQANAKGRYDNDDRRNPPKKDAFRLRGKVKTDAKGRFELLTIWPGRYKIGPKRWRPAHLHVKVSAPGYETLTTQLYFKGDPHNADDPWYDPARALEPKKESTKDKDGKPAGELWVASYELVLQPARKK